MTKLPIKCYHQKFVSRLGYTGFSFAAWIFFAESKEKVTPRLLNHETIHYRQQHEMLFIFQWLWYGVEYLVKRMKYKSHDTAYRNLSFEREAYANESNLEYLKTRRRWAWIKYIRGDKKSPQTLR